MKKRMNLFFIAARWLIKKTLFLRYRINVVGAEQIPPTGGVLLLGNHVSYIDWALILLTCPRLPYFVLSRHIYRKWHLSLFFKIFNHIILIFQEESKNAIQAISSHLQAGRVVVIFAEGHITRNGQLAPFQKGFEKAVHQTNACILPFYLLGVWGVPGSNASVKNRYLNKILGRYIEVYYGQPLANTTNAAEVRQIITQLSVHAWNHYPPCCHHTLASLWLLTNKKFNNKLAVADATGVKVSSLKLLVFVRFLQKTLSPLLGEQKNIGLLLPLSVGGVATNLALFNLEKIAINLNYTSGNSSLVQAISLANIKTIITSKQFIKKAESRGFELENLLEKVNTIYLEDIKSSVNKFKMVIDSLYCKLVPVKFLISDLSKINHKTAVILFSSGSEGRPKGVELSHKNLVTNVLQILNVIRFQSDDKALSTMPLFHAFGLTVNVLTPLFAGVSLICQSDPTDSVTVGKLAASYQATLLTGTSTFLNLYSRQRKVHPLMFQSIRLVIAGAEKLTNRVSEAFKLKFGLNIYEGYGATETSPVVSVCLPDVFDVNDGYIEVGCKAGSVGLPLPGTAIRIVNPDSLEDLPLGAEGLVLIGGPQVMPSYYQDLDRTQQAILVDKNIFWYKTGDKGKLDEDGFLYLVDRYSRFAKIGGEMVSLTAVEESVLSVLSSKEEAEVMALSTPDYKKGEIIILFYVAKIEESELQHLLARSAIENIMLPNKVIKMETLPKLGSGKNDYQTGKLILSRLFSESSM